MPDTEVRLKVNADGEEVCFRLRELSGSLYCDKAFHGDHPFGEMKKFSAGFKCTGIFLCQCGLRIVIPTKPFTIEGLTSKFAAFNPVQ